MAQILLAILIVVVVAYSLPDLARLRQFSWLRSALEWCTESADGGSRPRVAAALLPLLVVVACALVQLLLDQVLFGLAAFLFGVCVLYYSSGPRDLDADVDAVLNAPDGDSRLSAAQALRPDPAVAPLPVEAGPLVVATFASALSRWFGVLFWFVILGPAGAIGYRVVQLLARRFAFEVGVDSAQRDTLERIANVLDWAPAHLVALTLALVSEFDAVITTWREYHASHGRGYFTLDLGFLGALARAGVDADVVAGDGFTTDTRDPLVELADARKVLRRILIAWLALIAVLALAGLAHVSR